MYSRYAPTTKMYELQVPGSDPIRIIEAEEPFWNHERGYLTPQYVEHRDILSLNTDDVTTATIKDSIKNPVELTEETTTDSSQALKDFLKNYADKIKRKQNEADVNFEEVQMITADQPRNKLASVYLDGEEIEETVDVQHEKPKAWNVEKHSGGYTTKKGWVSLEAVPWSVSKISKWKHRPTQDDRENWEATLNSKRPVINWSQKNQKPNFDYASQNYYQKPTPYENEDEAIYEQIHPIQHSRPSSNKYSQENIDRDYSTAALSWNRRPTLSTFDAKPNYSDGKPYYNEENSHYNDGKPYHNENKPYHNEGKPYYNEGKPYNSNEGSQYYQNEGKPFHHAQGKPHYDERPHYHNEDCKHTNVDIITDGLPANFPKHKEPQVNRRRGTTNENLPSSHPFNGEGEWVLLSTTKGFKYPRRSGERSMQIEPDSIGAHRTVRLTVLPPLENSKVNMTTSHGGLLQVEQTFQTVEQSQRAYIKRQKYKKRRTSTTAKPYVDLQKPDIEGQGQRPIKQQKPYEQEQKPSEQQQKPLGQQQNHQQIPNSSQQMPYEHQQKPLLSQQNTSQQHLNASVQQSNTLLNNNSGKRKPNQFVQVDPMKITNNLQNTMNSENVKPVKYEILKPLPNKPQNNNMVKLPTVMPATVTSHKKGVDSSAVLAAVGAGMIPATMAMLVPMAMGGRKKRDIPIRFTLRETMPKYY